MGKGKKSKHRGRKHHRASHHWSRAKETQQGTEEKQKPFSPLVELYNMMCKSEMEDEDDWDSPEPELVKDEKQELTPTKSEDEGKPKE